MHSKTNIAVAGGICGLLSVASYLVIAFLDLPDSLTFLLAMLFPIFGIIFIYSLKEYIAAVNNSHINALSFTFGSLGFTLCAILLSAQLAVQIGIDVKTAGADAAMLKTIKESVRMVDMGIDVAWDMFISTYMLLFLFATVKVPPLKWWGIVSGVLGLLLMVFNVISFPVPPADAGMIDMGPFVALFWLMLSGRALGLRIPTPDSASMSIVKLAQE